MIFKTLIIFTSFVFITACTQVKEDKNSETQQTAENSIKLYSYAPSTVSSQAKAIIETFTDALSKPAMPDPDSIEQWKMIQQGMENATKDQNQALIDELDIHVSAIDLGGTRVLDIKPRGWKDNGNVLVYTHGGAYVLFSALSTIGISGIVAQATGLRVISIDYTLAPHANWSQISDEIVAVFKELIKQGYTMDDIGLFGDSAGGGLASTTVLRLRNDGIGMPAAVVLYSPMADLSCPGESYQTLKASEPMYDYELHMKTSFAAYADSADQKNPYVSSVYGDFTKGYSPTLIQGGTKELILSSFVRLFQAMDMAGVDVSLDIYEGMPHVFQRYPIPEAEVALNKANNFFKEHLEK